MMRYFILALLLFIGSSKPARAELAPTSLRQLVHSKGIVYARVERVYRDKGKWLADGKGKKRLYQFDLVGQAVVLRVLKGSHFFVGQRILIAAYSTWMCDATRVSTGEECVFFLNDKDLRSQDGTARYLWGEDIDAITRGNTLYFIAASGQGKYPISVQSGKIEEMAKLIQQIHTEEQMKKRKQATAVQPKRRR